MRHDRYHVSAAPETLLAFVRVSRRDGYDSATRGHRERNDASEESASTRKR